MKKQSEIEATLERSLRKQVNAPRLDRSFNAAVFARIAAEEQRATNPVTERVQLPSSARWLFVSNLIGVAVAMVLVVNFGMQYFSEVSVAVPAPQVSAATSAEIAKLAGWAVTGVSLVFGLMFTPLGRKLRAEFT